MAAHRIIFGDSRRMADVHPESVHLVVTSPPYWQLKDYGAPGQIGFDDPYEDYINSLNCVWMECHRALHPGCRLCVVIGDQFARSVFYGRYKIIPIKAEIVRFCETVGFDYMGGIIWQKVTTCNTSGGASIMGSFPYPRNGIVKLDYETILLFRKGGKPPTPTKEAKLASRLSKEEWNAYFSGHWRIAGGRQDRHLAVFPPELAERLIKMFSFYGETVLDPFLGSGTTSLAAERTGRDSIGYEINRAALPVMEEKLGMNDLIKGGSISVIDRQDGLPSREELFARLPYLFRDPVAIVRRMDPRQRDFGSRVGGARPRKAELYTVREVVSPEEVILGSGAVVRLMGVKRNGLTDREAVAYIEAMTKNQRVFLESDDGPARPDGHACYLYLKNRTFINAHLIKKGLVDVDVSLDYGKRKRFLSYLGSL